MCIANLVEPGDKVIVGNAGIWGERVADMTRRFRGERSVRCRRGRAVPVTSARKPGHRRRTVLLLSGKDSNCARGVPSAFAPHNQLLRLRATGGVHMLVAGDVIELKAPLGETFSYETLKANVEKHKPALLFLVQVRRAHCTRGRRC